jgi:hypothetical protein
VDIAEIAAKLQRLNPRVAAAAERLAVAIPAVRSRLDRQYDRMLAAMEASVKPYRGQAASTSGCRPTASPRMRSCGRWTTWRPGSGPAGGTG